MRSKMNKNVEFTYDHGCEWVSVFFLNSLRSISADSGF